MRYKYGTSEDLEQRVVTWCAKTTTQLLPSEEMPKQHGMKIAQA